MERTILVVVMGALLIASTASVALAATRYGTDGNDLLTGTAGADQIHGFAGDDLMYGLGGRDAMYGGSGDDAIYGRAGNDSLYGGGGSDRLNGGSGDDFIDARDGRRDEVTCGSGRDSYSVDSSDEVSSDCEVPAIR